MHPHPGPAAPTIGQQQLVQPSLASLETVLLVPTSGDGHCFMHALRISMATYLHATFEQQEVLRLLKNEIIANKDKYVHFLPYPVATFRQQTRDYFYLRQYNCDFGDLIPLAASIALGLQIFITPSHNIRLTDSHIICPSNTAQQDSLSYVIMQL